MVRPFRYLLVVMALFYGYPAVAASVAPLFASDDILKITLSAPFTDIKKFRNKETRYKEARVSYTNDQGNAVEIPVTLSLRGNSRLDLSTCTFPPLRLKFNKEDAKDTVFQKLKKVKMVTQCQPISLRSQDDLLTEYQAYRILNSLTDWSYRVRLLDVTYVDSGGGKTRQNYAFLIEPSKNLAKRTDSKKINVDAIATGGLIGEHMNLISLYQLLLGNTDWSATQGGANECCHNGKLFGDKALLDTAQLDTELLDTALLDTALLDKVLPNIRFVPYDFDVTGLVEPEYAVPAQHINLSSVSKRRYRGYCQNLEHLNANVTLLNQKRDDIENLLKSEIGVSKTRRWRNLNYIKSFYKLINNSKRLTKHASRYCVNDPVI